MRLKRYDKITLDRSKVIRLDNGMMRVPARLSRVGVQEYRRPDGSIERAFRPSDEVGKSASSFDAVTLVDDHPRENNAVVDSSNVKRLGVGVVLNPVFRDGFVEAELLISDATAVAKVEAGKVELSAGYFIDRDETPGVAPDGQKYDFVHRNIRANHVAIVDAGRAGPDVRIQLDSAVSTDLPISGAVGAAKTSPHGETPMFKITVDGVEVEVSQTAATLFQKERTMAAGLLEAAKAETVKVTKALEQKTAQCDAATEKIGKLEAELKTAPEKARAAMAERSAVEAQAKAIAPEVKCDALDLMGIKRAVLTHAKIVADGKSDDYVSARFDALADEAAKKNPATEAAQRELNDPARTKVTDSKIETPTEARAKAEADFFAKK